MTYTIKIIALPFTFPYNIAVLYKTEKTETNTIVIYLYVFYNDMRIYVLYSTVYVISLTITEI